jgi:hypothetical protein
MTDDQRHVAHFGPPDGTEIEKRPDTEVIEFARELDSQIRQLAHHAHIVIEALCALVEEAKANNIHEHLGFPSWTAYIADALDGQWKVERDKRGQVIRFLAEQGMSRRAISKVTGTGKGTVYRELSGAPLGHVIGLDGKTYPRLGPVQHDSEESDDEWLARKMAEMAEPRTIPATVEQLRWWGEEMAADEFRLNRMRYEAEIAEIEQLPKGYEQDARWVGTTLRYEQQQLRNLQARSGSSIEELAEATSMSVYAVRDHLYPDEEEVTP